MAEEIEHKYLVVSDDYKQLAQSIHEIRQGYLSRNPDRVVRVRLFDDKGYITIKSRNHGAVRLEFEYEIPKDDAIELLGLCEKPIIHKIRYAVEYEGFVWEIDRFISPCDYTVAEIELPDDKTEYSLPSFIGENVTGRPEYYNSNIS